MRTGRLVGLLAALAAALALAACGGGGGPSAAVSDGAAFAPSTAAVFVELDTDAEGVQWRRADALLDRFPGRADLLDALGAHLEDDGLSLAEVEPALGDALYAVVLGAGVRHRDGAVSETRGSRESTVYFARPRDRQTFERLVEALDDHAHRQIDGWTVAAADASLIERFEEARSQGVLADESSFRDAMDALPQDALVRVYVSGPRLQRALDEGLRRHAGADGLTRQLGRLESFAGAATAETEGLRLAAHVAAEGVPEAKAYTPELPGAVPAGALAYVSFGDVRETLQRVLRAAGEAGSALGLGELGLGLLPAGDEGGVAVYRGRDAEEPGVSLYLAVHDEAAARAEVDRLVSLAQLGARATTRTFMVDGVRVRELVLPDAGVTLFAAVSGGRLIVANSEAVLRDSLDGGRTLADDPAFRAARTAARLPGEVGGFLYVNVREAIPARLEAKRGKVPREVRENAAALRSLLVFAERDGEQRRLRGFLSIE